MVVSFMIAVPYLGAAPCGRPHPYYEHDRPDPTPPPGRSGRSAHRPGLALRRRADLSVSLAYHYFALRFGNEIEPFRYRLRGENVLVYDVIHAGTTVLLPNESFIMAYFDYEEDFEKFMSAAMQSVAEARSAGKFEPEPADDAIHFTVLPWASFTSFSHARNWSNWTCS